MGCLGQLFRIVLGLGMLLILLIAGCCLVFSPYTPEDGSTKNPDFYTHVDGEEYCRECVFDVPEQSGETHDYIMDNTRRKIWVEMEFTKATESGLKYVIKVFKSVLGEDYSPLIISGHDHYEKNNLTSHHGTGRAVDISTAGIPMEQKNKIYKILLETLPTSYKVRVEKKFGEKNVIHFQSNN